VTKAAAVLIAAATASLALRPRPLVLLWPLLEDGFYSFTVARNVALGRGITVDGVSRTNGFQPLFTALSVPAFALSGTDRVLAVRLVLVLHWLFYVGAAVVLGLVARRLLAECRPGLETAAFWAALFLYLANPLVFQAHFNGLETGCVLFLYAAVCLGALSLDLGTGRGRALLGALLGLTVLARIDAVFFVAAVCAYLLAFPGPGRSRRDRLHAPAIVAAVSLLVSSPWWLYNAIGFGSLMPSSGASQQEWGLSASRTGAALLSLARLAVPWWTRFDPGRFDREPWADGVRAVLFLAGALHLWRRRPSVRGWLAPEAGAGVRPSAWAIACILAASLGLLAWYTASSFAFWFYARYLSPLLLVVTLVFARLWLVVASRWPPLAVLLVGVLGWSVPWAALSSHRTPVEKGNIMFTDQLPLVQERVPAGECVAALQSGTLGFFRDCVVNLDGKVNAEALLRRRDIWRYLDERGVRWVCDWPALFRTYFGARPDQEGWEAVETRNKFVLYRRAAVAGPERRP
jgi:hypothetical protein